MVAVSTERATDAKRQPKLCASCGELFTPSRSDARTCSDRCRQRLRRGHAATLLTDTGVVRPLTDAELAEAGRAEAERIESKAETRALSAEARAARKDIAEALRALAQVSAWTTTLAEVDLPTTLAHLDEVVATKAGLGLRRDRVPGRLTVEASRDPALLAEQVRDILDTTIERLRDVQRRLGR
jgi:hypothetical protein